MLVLVERGKPEYPQENFSQQRKDQQKTQQPIYGVDAGIWARATLEGNKSRQTQNGEPSVCPLIVNKVIMEWACKLVF